PLHVAPPISSPSSAPMVTASRTTVVGYSRCRASAPRRCAMSGQGYVRAGPTGDSGGRGPCLPGRRQPRGVVVLGGVVRGFPDPQTEQGLDGGDHLVETPLGGERVRPRRRAVHEHAREVPQRALGRLGRLARGAGPRLHPCELAV